VLRRSIELAKQFQTDRVRCFDFWRLEDQAPYRKAINQKLRDAAAVAAKSGIKLVLENEMTCNTATAAEAAQVLAAIPDPNLLLNWDPGNAAAAGRNSVSPRLSPVAERPHRPLPLQGCDSQARRQAPNGQPWAAASSIGWDNSARCAKTAIACAASLETHWHGAGTPERILAAKLGWNAKGIARCGRFVNARLRQLKIRQVPG